MTAPAETTTPAARTGAPSRPARRHGAASRHAGAAGQTRRTLQRDLARREASLRISRRVSGPAAGVSRPPLADAPVSLPEVAPFQAAPAPAPQPAPAAPAAPSQPGSALDIPSFVQPSVRPAQARVAPKPPQRPAPQRAVPPRSAPQRAAAPRPAAPPRVDPARVEAAARPVAQAGAAAHRPMVAPRTRPAVAAALAAAPARLPFSLPSRPRLVALPGGLVETAPAGKRRVSTPAVMVTAIMVLILTVGAILGLQIRKTQVNEQMGADLGEIAALQQKVTATREELSRTIAATNVDDSARKGGLFEPDLRDVRFTRVGNAKQSADRARRLLEKAPVAPTAAQVKAAAAKAQAEAAAATTGVAAGAVDTATGTTPAPTSAAGTSMGSVPSAATPQSQATAPSTTGTGAIQ